MQIFVDFSIDEKTIRGSFLQDLENKDEIYEQNKLIIKPHWCAFSESYSVPTKSSQKRVNRGILHYKADLNKQKFSQWQIEVRQQ